MLQKQAVFGIDKYEDKYFEKHLYIFNYEGIIRKIILNYKFNEKAYLYKTFINFALKNEKFFNILQTYDTIIPVPISKQRMKQRGYNQSLLLSSEIVNNVKSKNKKIELNNICLYKRKNAIEQSKLSKEQRVQNIQNVYELKNEQYLKNKKILLIDDIYTTGSTANECCRMLNMANPKSIEVLTIAKD